MYKKFLKAFIAFLFISLSTIGFGQNTSCYNEAPVKLLDSTVESFLTKLGTYKKPSLSQIIALVNQNIVPHTNFNVTARLVLGQKWRSINATQKKEFVVALKKMVLNTYSSAFVSYDGEEIDIKCPISYNTKKNRVEINSKVTHPQKRSFYLKYRLFKKGDKWFVYDIIIDNVSIVNSYRQTVKRLIEQNKDFNQVLKVMEKKAKINS
tara:strand:+ start:85803 stop:86426 length:624 start_codon:yes stop_codon:yes gene_type:complete